MLIVFIITFQCLAEFLTLSRPSIHLTGITKSHEAEKEREVLAWKLRRKSQKFIIFLEDGQDIKRMRAMWAESGF